MTHPCHVAEPVDALGHGPPDVGVVAVQQAGAKGGHVQAGEQHGVEAVGTAQAQLHGGREEGESGGERERLDDADDDDRC